MTGAKFFAKDLNMDLKDMTIDDLGNAHKVVVAKDTTTIIDGTNDPEAVKQRIDEIKQRIENSTSEYDKKR